MKNLSDEELIVLFAQGKNEAFDELLDRYKSNVYSYIMTIVQNKEVAEDIFQDTFTKVIMTIKSGRYSETGKFVAYLFRIAHNRVIDFYRQEQNLGHINACDVEYDIFAHMETLEAASRFEPSMEDEVCYNQILRDIRRMIKFLPLNQRDIIVMRFYKDMSFKEIADALGISINTALGRMRYAVLNLRKLAERHNISLAV